ncbi:hypothetical protein EDC96DRAFT_590198 [Choanephora cucurbitarum]|nr:hypothetical protein EDC96DRAFT_590198 [Choanephora cucurbitarum]
MTSTTDANAYSGFRPRLIEFHGYEGEDFRHFRHTLDTFFSICGINSGARKLTILVSQLRRAASTFYSRYLKTIQTDNPDATLTYEDAINVLQDKYITPALVQRFELAFNDMVQGANESPQLFLSRLYEAAELAEIDDDNMIHSRFRAGLLRPIRVFCIECSSKTFDDWVNHADGWWNAHKPVDVNLVDNPFVTSGSTAEVVSSSETPVYPNMEGQVLKNLKATMAADNGIYGRKRMPVHEGKVVSRGGVNTMDSEVEQLAARLKNPELHYVGQLTDSEGARSITSKYNLTRSQDTLEADIRNLIRDAVKKELQTSGSHRSDRFTQDRYDDVRGSDGYRQRYNNRRRYNGNFNQASHNGYQDTTRRPDYYDNDYASPGEGYYPNMRNSQRGPDMSHNNKNGAGSKN